MHVLEGQFPERWAGIHHETPPTSAHSTTEQCLLHNQHLPWARGWRGRAGCPGWIVRRPWRCKDRTCCCCNCCIWRSCCWKANCWVATCCCCKKSGRKKKEMAMSHGRLNASSSPKMDNGYWSWVESSVSSLVSKGQNTSPLKRGEGVEALPFCCLLSQKNNASIKSAFPTVWKAWVFVVKRWTCRLWDF